jgi:ADP-ribose pyrophosphatase YjhB (NUDIX family)
MPTALYYLHDPFAPDPNCPTRFGSAVIIEAEGKILMEKRVDNFRWGIISGDMHATETFKDTAIRKTMKETGIKLFSDQLKPLKVFDDPSRIVSFLDGNIYRIVSFGYAVQLDQIPETSIGRESLELRWVEPHELVDLNLVITHQEILEYYFKLKNIDIDLPQQIWKQ